MKSTPRVSIVTPSYNQAAYLELAMRSVLDQGYPNLEYMVVDGGSTDGSREIIEKYASQLAWWVSERDHGQSEAINKGFQRVTGEIIGWLNSDDLYTPGAIATAVQVFEEHPDVGIVFGNVLSIDGNGEVFNRMIYGPWGLKELMTFHVIGQPAVFIRRSVLEAAGGLDLSYHLLLDHELWLRMACRAKMLYVPKDFACARYHAAAKNVAQAEKYGVDAYRLVRWMESDPAFKEMIQPIRRQVWAGAQRLDAFYTLDSGNPGKALRTYWKSFWNHPPTALQDWRRILYALFSPFGIGWVREAYLKQRKIKMNANR